MQAVLFDLGNTLVGYYRAQDFSPILRESITGICEYLREHTSLAVDTDRVYKCALELNVEDPEYRVRPLEDRLREIFRDFPLTNDIVREMGSIFLRPIFGCAKLDPNALPTLAAIRQLGIRTAIVSNTPWGSSAEPWSAELHRHGLSSAVDAVVFCVDVGWRKPASQIFEHALSPIGAKAQHAFFVGDDPRQDIAGAERSGLRPILLDPGGDAADANCQRIRSIRQLSALLDEGATP